MRGGPLSRFCYPIATMRAEIIFSNPIRLHQTPCEDAY